MLTTERKADKEYKAGRGVAQTSTTRAAYEETHSLLRRVIPSQVWYEADKIPATAPGGINAEVTGVVQRYIRLALQQEAGRTNAFYNALLKDAIDPERFGLSYAIQLYDSLGAVIAAGTGNYEVDVDAGVVMFDDGYVVANLPVSCSFYRYVGVKGVIGDSVGRKTLTGVAIGKGYTVVIHGKGVTACKVTAIDEADMNETEVGVRLIDSNSLEIYSEVSFVATLLID